LRKEIHKDLRILYNQDRLIGYCGSKAQTYLLVFVQRKETTDLSRGFNPKSEDGCSLFSALG